MTVRNVKKNLAGQQDLLGGIGPFSQVRRGETIIVDGYAKSYIRLWKDFCGSGYKGTFEDGCTVTSGTDIVLSLTDGEAYTWSGSIPVDGKVLTAGSTPNDSGGIGPGLWGVKLTSSLLDALTSAEGAGMVGTKHGTVEEALNNRWANSGSDKKEIFFDLPLIFPDYNAILVANPGWTFIYPGSFTISNAGLIYITYGPSDNSSTKRFVVVYSSTGSYLGYIQTDNGGTGTNGSAVSEGIVVTEYYGGLKLFLGSYDGNIYEYDISSLVYGSSISFIASHQVGLYNQFSFLNGTWVVEQAVPAIGQIRQRNILAYFNSLFSLTGYAELDFCDSGYITSTTTAYGALLNKRQGLTLAPGLVIGAFGGVYIDGTTVEQPTNQQGVKVFTESGVKILEAMSLPSKFISALEALGKSATRIENEGVSYHAGSVYTLWIYSDRLSPVALTGGILITKEFSMTPDLYLSDTVTIAPVYNATKMATGVFPRVLDGDILKNPVTGASMPAIADVLDFMRLASQKVVTVYTSSTPLNDFSGVAYPSGASIRITTLNNLSFDVDITLADRKTFLRAVFSDPTYTVGDALIIESKRIMLDGVDSGPTVFNRLTGRSLGFDTALDSKQILMLDQQGAAAANSLIIGGASGSFLSATSVSFATNPSSTTLGGTIRWRIDETSLRPFADNVYSVGNSILRPSVIWAATGAISTSDAREKTDLLPMGDDFLDAIDAVYIGLYQWLVEIANKGEDVAREHSGAIAQQVRDAFLAAGLDGCRYGLLCYDKWDNEYSPVLAERRNLETNQLEEYDTGEVQLTREAGDRWSLRESQCHWALHAAARRRFERLEERVSRLEL